MSRLRAVPTMPAHAPKIKYRVPMSLWLVENSHRLMNVIGKVRWLSVEALGCSPFYRGLIPLLIGSVVKFMMSCKLIDVH